MSETKKIILEDDAAKELVLAATGLPYFIAVVAEGKTMMRWSDDFNIGSVLKLIEHLAETNKQFKDVMINWFIDYSKTF